MNTFLSVAIYSYRGARRADHALWCLRHLGGDDLDAVVAEDLDASSGDTTKEYAAVCERYGARHVPLKEHGHMSAANHAAVEATTTPWVLVLSDDVLVPRGLIPCVQKFLKDNWHPRDRWGCFLERAAGFYLHHWDRPDIQQMVDDGTLPELAGWNVEQGFYATNPDDPNWWWKLIDYRLPYGGWSEQTPPERAGICSNVHGSGFLVQRKYWDLVGGVAGVDSWQNDSVLSYRVGQFTDGFFMRLPWLPSLAHHGAAAPTPPDPTGRWRRTIWNLSRQHGGEYDREIRDTCNTDKPQNCLPIIERGLKLRAYALQLRFEEQIADLDYSYRELWLTKCTTIRR